MQTQVLKACNRQGGWVGRETQRLVAAAQPAAKRCGWLEAPLFNRLEGFPWMSSVFGEDLIWRQNQEETELGSHIHEVQS